MDAGLPVGVEKKYKICCQQITEHKNRVMLKIGVFIKDKIRYLQIKRTADNIIGLSDHYYQGCMYQRNRYLGGHSAACICFLTEDTSGTAYTVRYAQSKGLKIFNLARPKEASI